MNPRGSRFAARGGRTSKVRRPGVASQGNAKAIPALPARNLPELLIFYRRLGFAVTFEQYEPDEFAVIERDTIEIHLFGFPNVDPASAYTGCYLRVPDADALYRQLERAALPTEGIPRLTAPRDMPWNMREFHIVDPTGNLLRVGHVIERPTTQA